MILAVLSLMSVLEGAPCVRPTRAGTQVQGEVRICPGRYRIADPAERGIIIAAASGTRIDLTGVVLESGDSVPGRFVGVGIASRGVDGVTITGGAIHGFRYGVQLEGGRTHRVTGTDLSGSRNQIPRSTPARPDAADRLDLMRPDSFLPYGGGVLLQGTVAASITGVTARGAQNGIALLDARESYIADNDVGANSGWGIHLWRSSRNIIARNRVDHTRRCESQVPAGECGAAAVLLRDASDSNTIVDNDLTASSLGFLLAGERRNVRPSIGNLVYRNDASTALSTGFTAAFGWSNTFLENRADSVAIGFRLDHSGGTIVERNTVIGARNAGIVSDHGADIAVLGNVLIGGALGIKVGAPEEEASQAGGIALTTTCSPGWTRASWYSAPPGPNCGATSSMGWVMGWCSTGRDTPPRSPATSSCAPRAGSSRRPISRPAGTTGPRPTPRGQPQR